MQEFVDVSKKEIIDAILPDLKQKLEAASKVTGQSIEVVRLEWTSEGIRIWMQPVT